MRISLKFSKAFWHSAVQTKFSVFLFDVSSVSGLDKSEQPGINVCNMYEQVPTNALTSDLPCGVGQFLTASTFAGSVEIPALEKCTVGRLKFNSSLLQSL